MVDDDAVFLKLLEIEFLQFADFHVETYATGELCLENMHKNPDIVILDFHLDGIDKSAMDGIETLKKIKAQWVDIPVIMLSSQDKIEVAVECMLNKATDYVVKSETAFFRLQKVISDIHAAKEMKKELNWYMSRM